MEDDPLRRSILHKKIVGKQTLYLEGIRSLPLWRGVYALLAILVAGSLIAELVARTSLGFKIPPPSVGTDSFEFDTKIYYLEQSIRRRGALDCLILGDSMTNNGPDPRIVEEAYRAKTGASIHCFNFGLPALFLDASGPLAEALVNRFQPKLLILILSARNFEESVDFPIRYVGASDWTEYNLGKPTLRGWAVNSLYGYRYALSMQYWLSPSNRESFSETWQMITTEGFSPANGFGEQRELDPDPPEFERSYPPAQSGFEQLMDLKREGTSILIVDAPIRPDVYSLWQATYFQPYIAYMQGTLSRQGIPFWLTREVSDSVPADGWYDLQHVNERGVPVFSTWLGEQLTREYPPEFFE
jgi:hypothetical protein